MQFSEEEIQNMIQEEMLKILKEKSTTPLEAPAIKKNNSREPAYSGEVDDKIGIMIGYDYKG